MSWTACLLVIRQLEPSARSALNFFARDAGDSLASVAHPSFMNVLACQPLNRAVRCLLCAALSLCCLLLLDTSLCAQQPPEGPMEPPPEHKIVRIGNTSDPGAPPAVPVEEAIKKLSSQEDNYLQARAHYTYRKTVRIQELGPDGKATGEYLMVTQPAREPDGTIYDRIVEHPKSTLQHMQLESEDFETLNRMPSFALTTAQLSKYSLKYLGKDQVDEIECYIFDVRPKMVERKNAYFQGIVYIDDKYLEVVKSYGSWVTDLGEMKSSAQLPFTLFETYREFIDGKYWFPTYARSDETLHLKDQNIPIKMVIKWSDFKPLASSAAPSASPSAPASGAPTKTAPSPSGPLPTPPR